MRRPSGPTETSVTVRGSRFLAVLDTAVTPEAATARQQGRQALHADATHHCWAYRIWTPGAINCGAFDAGEPGGTAGRPILGALERDELVDAVCIVTRWFGGTKLGTGGLTRAYGEAARQVVRAAIDAGSAREVAERARFEARFAYAATASVSRVVARYGAREENAEYGEVVRLVLAVAANRGEAFAAALIEAASGEIAVERLDMGLGSGATS